MSISTIVGIILTVVLIGLTIAMVVYLLSLKDKEADASEDDRIVEGE